ncbi:hypothetical protein [Candidatus Uabimicrobium sp. HlEnr_7]|uniref:hypothetical protein n=1 Tax=Candidatus Uabimicrobium helgolandensis TaxID=3095367 RepID=UPI003558686B
MALINCDECKAQISSHADACPHCGYPMKKNQNINNSYSNDKKMGGFVLFLLTSVFIIAFSALGGYGAIFVVAELKMKEIGLLGNLALIPAGAVFGGFLGFQISKILFSRKR